MKNPNKQTSKRTKANKLQARLRRAAPTAQETAVASHAAGGFSFRAPTSSAQSRAASPANPSTSNTQSPQNNDLQSLFGYDLKLIRGDFSRTILSTVFVTLVLGAIAWSLR